MALAKDRAVHLLQREDGDLQALEVAEQRDAGEEDEEEHERIAWHNGVVAADPDDDDEQGAAREAEREHVADDHRHGPLQRAAGLLNHLRPSRPVREGPGDGGGEKRPAGRAGAHRRVVVPEEPLQPHGLDVGLARGAGSRVDVAVHLRRALLARPTARTNREHRGVLSPARRSGP